MYALAHYEAVLLLADPQSATVILVQGLVPILWSSMAEVVGVKTCYVVSMGIYSLACLATSRINSISAFLGLRVLQAVGGAALLALGAGTLAAM